ncbi:MAG TPA: sigma-70 family RNA polymerase sigma factor [Solirubrobacteraceae bacterium]|jgi:RNA polymerase sigma-70 factor (ECF subfamily)
MPEPIEDANEGGLMLRIADGDTRAFEIVYARYRTQALALALRITRQSAAAEDVTQEAFLNLWRSAARYEPNRGSLKAWLLRIVHNGGVDNLRRGRHVQGNVQIEDVRAQDLRAPECTDATVFTRDESRHMRRLLSDLPIKQREVVELTYYRELSHTEVADDLGLPLGTVKGRLRLAHARLHRELAAVA